MGDLRENALEGESTKEFEQILRQDYVYSKQCSFTTKQCQKTHLPYRGWEMVRHYGIWNGEDPSKGVVSINTKHHMSISSTVRPKQRAAWRGNGNWMLLVSDPDAVSGQWTRTPAAVSTGNSKANGELLFSPSWGFTPGKWIMLQHLSRSWLSNPEGHRVQRLRKQKALLSSGWDQLWYNSCSRNQADSGLQLKPLLA